MNPPREGKKLLVLDLDYSEHPWRQTALPAAESTISFGRFEASLGGIPTSARMSETLAAQIP